MTKIAEPRPAGPTVVGSLAAFERHIGHALPAEYREFLLAHNGGRPVPDAFTLTVGDRTRNDDMTIAR